MWGGEDGGPALSAACPRGMVTDLEGSPGAASTHLPLTALHDDQLLLGGRPGKDDLRVVG